MIVLAWAETRKLLRTPAIWVTSGLCLMYPIWAYATTRHHVNSGSWEASLLSPQFSFTYASANLAVIASLLTVFIGAVSVGMEFGYKTWSSLLTHGTRRWQLWLAKLLSVATIVSAWVLSSLILSYAGSVWATGQLAPPLVNGEVLAQIGVLLFSLLFWAVFAFTAGLAFRGSGAAIAAGILFPYGNMMLEGAGRIKMWLPIWNQRALNVAVFGTEMNGVSGFFADPEFPPVWQAVIVLSVMFLALLMMSFYFLRQLRAD